MDGLQRSTISFRRQGSSGLVWDDKFLSGELNQDEDQEKAESKEEPRPSDQLRRSRSNRQRTYRTNREVSPTIDPPSPKVSSCGFCGMFGKPQTTTRKPKSCKP